MNYIKIIIYWLIAVLIVNPIGEFPLNDDWAYTKNVQYFLDSGHFVFVDWSAMTLVSQLLIASFFCKIFGFSFTLLRIITLCVALFGVLLTYKITLNVTSNKKIALFSSLVIASNPVFFVLSNTFMTDVYFFTFSLITIYFFERFFTTEKTYFLIIATIFSIVATMTRQIGVLLPLSFILIHLVKFKNLKISTLFKIGLPFLLTFAALFSFNNWFEQTQLNQTTYISFKNLISSINFKIFERSFNRIGTTIITLSFFLSPLLLLFFPLVKNNILKKENKLVSLFSFIFLIPVLRAWSLVPINNVMYNLGLGPKLLKDSYLLKTYNYPVLNDTILILIKVVCIICSFILIFTILTFIKKAKKSTLEKVNQNKLSHFSLIYSALVFCTFVIPIFFFDRYIIQLLIPFILILVSFNVEIRGKKAYISILTICVFSIFSIGLSHDYLAWNKARWRGLNFLTENQNISPKNIDGGFEFNAYNQTSTIQNNTKKSWWFVNDDTYLASFTEIEGYKTIKLFEYYQYIPFEKKYIHISKKI